MIHRRLAGLVLAALSAAGCKREEPPPGAAVSPSVVAGPGSAPGSGSASNSGSGSASDSPSAFESAPESVAKGKQAVGALKRQLVATLTAALKSGAPAAIEACSSLAPGIAQSLGGRGVTVGRATRKPRNPANAASGWRADALAQFEAMVAAGRPLDGATWTSRLPDGTTAYAEPLIIQPLCLACHGSQLAPGVQAVLAARYPADQATGYALGELRGVAWAELARPPP